MDKLSTIRLIIAIAASKGWKLTQLDVNNAFLHGDLEEIIYMEALPGLSTPKGHVCLLQIIIWSSIDQQTMLCQIIHIPFRT